jgi:hypothetical protein
MKPRRFILISATLLILTGLIFYLSHLNEPTYEGRSLTSWLRQLDTPQSPGAPAFWGEEDGQPPEIVQAIRAIRVIGTNGVPILLNLLKSKDDTTYKYKNEVEKIINRLGFSNFHFYEARQKRRWAECGFIILGKQAQSAAPELMQIVQRNPDQQSAFEALHCLENLKLEDKTMVHYLIETLGNTNHALSSYAATRHTFRYPTK